MPLDRNDKDNGLTCGGTAGREVESRHGHPYANAELDQFASRLAGRHACARTPEPSQAGFALAVAIGDDSGETTAPVQVERPDESD